MSDLLSMRLELGEVTDGDDNPLYDEAVIHFAGLHDSPEININAPNALRIASRIVELWNAVLPPPLCSGTETAGDTAGERTK
jgi:hypothetical protein